MALAIGALVDAAIVLPIAPPRSLSWQFADRANGGNFNEEIGWPCVALAGVDVAQTAFARVSSSAAKAYLRVQEVLLI